MKQDCLHCTQRACSVSVMARTMLQGLRLARMQSWRCGATLASWSGRGGGRGKAFLTLECMRLEPERGIRWMNHCSFSTRKKITFSLHLACSNRCIYVAAPETAMCNSDRRPTGTSNKLGCHTWEVSLNDLIVPEVVSFSCIIPSMFSLPFTGHWSRSIKRGKKKYSLEMRF